MSHLSDRADVHSYFASMNPLASKIMESLATVKDHNEVAWQKMEPEVKDDLFKSALVPANVKNLYWTEDEYEVEVFPKFVSSVAKKIIVDDTDGKTWEDEHSGQFSWETGSQLELNLSDLDSVATPAVPRKSQDSTGSATSPNAVKPTPVRKARLVENWLDSPVLKAMQENSSASQSEGSDREQLASSEEPDILKKFGITFSGGSAGETSTEEVFTPTKRSASPPSKRHSSRHSRPDSLARSPTASSPPPAESQPNAASTYKNASPPPLPPSPPPLPPSPTLPVASSPTDARRSFRQGSTIEVNDVSLSIVESRRLSDASRGKEKLTDDTNRDEEKEEEKSLTETTTRTTTLPVVECDEDDDDAGEDFFTKTTTTTTESVTAVKTGFDFLDNW